MSKKQLLHKEKITHKVTLDMVDIMVTLDRDIQCSCMALISAGHC